MNNNCIVFPKSLKLLFFLKKKKKNTEKRSLDIFITSYHAPDVNKISGQYSG